MVRRSPAATDLQRLFDYLLRRQAFGFGVGFQTHYLAVGPRHWEHEIAC